MFFVNAHFYLVVDKRSIEVFIVCISTDVVRKSNDSLLLRAQVLNFHEWGPVSVVSMNFRLCNIVSVMDSPGQFKSNCF